MRLLSLLILLAVSGAKAATPAIALKTTTEEGKKMIVATVTLDGKPVENATVSFYVELSFGNLPIGEDKTLEDGSAAVPVPEGLANGPRAELRIVAQAAVPSEPGAEAKTSPEVVASSTPTEPATPAEPIVVRAQLGIEGIGRKLEHNPFPRALWAPRAPIPLLVTVGGILVVVWGTYAFVIFELVKIKQGNKR